MADHDEDMEHSSDEDNDDLELKNKLKGLNDRLEASAEDYDAHVEKISVLRSAGELDDLREARRAFAKVYPLSDVLWIEWTADEQKLASTEEEISNVLALYDAAVKDYVSVDLWLEYCQFSLRGLDTVQGIAKARDVFERAVAAVGLHVAKGSLIWATYRDFESAMFNLDNSPSQKDRIDKLFRRQLAVPLLDMNNTLAEYQDFLGGDPIDPNVERQYKAALDMLQPREDLESKLLSLDASDEDKKLEIYSDYLALEFENRNPARLQCLFERRITDLCLKPHCWIKYVDYLDKTLKMKSVSVPVYERAVRNVPHCADVWIKYLRCLEKFQSPIREIRTAFEAAMTKNFEVHRYTDLWLAYIDCYRRVTDFFDGDEIREKPQDELRTIFKGASDFLWSLKADPDFKVMKYWATVEADTFKSMSEARKLWSTIVNEIGHQSKPWLEYAQLEATLGGIKHQRKVYQRAIERIKDDPKEVIESWLSFERMEGDLEQVEDCEAKVQSKMKRWEKFNEQQQQQESPKTNKKRDLKRKRPPNAEKAPSREEPVFKKPSMPPVSQPTESKKPAPPPGFQPEKKTVKPPPGFSGDAPKPPPGFKGEAPKPPPGFPGNSAPECLPPPGVAADEKKRTVFLSNLDFTVSEEDIRAALGQVSGIEEVRLVKNYAGKSKGFSYVKFSSESEAQKALSLDHQILIKNRPLFISEFKEDKSTPTEFRYSTEMEKNKLFVKGLSQSTSKEDLESLFAQHGQVKSVRLVTYRNGHSKGIAYVEFLDDESASKALMKTDGTTVDGHEISVAISRPPPRKEAPKAAGPSLGAGPSKDTFLGPRGRGRTQLSMVPRAVKSSEPSTNGSSEPKSNADFRSMLLKK